MLSDREEQELGLIEEGLRDDSRLAASFRNGRRRPLHRHPRIVRAAIVLGLVLTVGGPILAAAGLTLQGLLLAGVSYLWWRWKVKPTLAQPALATSPVDRRWWGFPHRR
jgi:Protein of unknown function (DUF3040)